MITVALAEKLDISAKAVKIHLVNHKDDDIIERISPAKNGYWKLRNAPSRLGGNITKYNFGDTPREVSSLSVDSELKSIDLMYFDRNISKAFGKRRIHTAAFIKNVFAHALRDIEVSTIERKMSHTECECKIILNHNLGQST